MMDAADGEASLKSERPEEYPSSTLQRRAQSDRQTSATRQNYTPSQTRHTSSARPHPSPHPNSLDMCFTKAAPQPSTPRVFHPLDELDACAAPAPKTRGLCQHLHPLSPDRPSTASSSACVMELIILHACIFAWACVLTHAIAD